MRSAAHVLDTMGALCWRELLRFARERSALYATLARPLLWLVILGSGMQNAFRDQTGVSYAAFMLPGIMTMTILFGGLFSGVSTVWDREFGFLKEILVAPISRVEIVLGKLLAGSLVTALQAMITLAFAPLIGVWVAPWSVVAVTGVVLLTSAGVVALALAIAGQMRSFEGFSNFANLLALPLFFLSGAMYPIENAPSWLRPVVMINPMTYAVDAMRQVMLGVARHALSTDLAVLVGFALLAGAAATLSFKRAS